MPLLDHFHPPVQGRYPWESLHGSWATRLADLLNDQWLSPEYLAVPQAHAGGMLEIDVATFEQEPEPADTSGNGTRTATLPARVWTPPKPRTMPGVFPDSFEVKIFQGSGGWTLVGAIEIVSPGNKDRADKRRAFATKCASYLYQGVSVVVI